MDRLADRTHCIDDVWSRGLTSCAAWAPYARRADRGRAPRPAASIPARPAGCVDGPRWLDPPRHPCGELASVLGSRTNTVAARSVGSTRSGPVVDRAVRRIDRVTRKYRAGAQYVSRPGIVALFSLAIFGVENNRGIRPKQQNWKLTHEHARGVFDSGRLDYTGSPSARGRPRAARRHHDVVRAGLHEAARLITTSFGCIDGDGDPLSRGIAGETS